jgi:HAD superfamily hydrolase (TIGR01509 family)
MDGVLVRSEEIWLRLLEEAGRRFRGSPITREEFAPTFGQGTAADVSVFGLRCTPAELDRYYVENFRHHLGGMWVNPEAAPLLDTLRARGFRLGVVTNTVTELAEEVLRASELRSRVDGLSCADMVSKPKPSPDLVHHALDLLAVRAEQAWLVGDSRYDREAAADAGVHFIGMGLPGDAQIEHLRELLPLVDREGARP